MATPSSTAETIAKARVITIGTRADAGQAIALLRRAAAH